MTRFARGVAAYLALCSFAIVGIVVRGDGPHPRVTGIYPRSGDRYWPGGYVQISFSQPMNEASVERALEVSPGTQGQGVWYGTTLNLQPVADWRNNVTYHVSLTGTVTDDQGRPLHTPVSFWFRVHHVRQAFFCPVRGVRNVCERDGGVLHPLTDTLTPVLQFALAPDGSAVVYSRRDGSGLPHLFIRDVDGRGEQQLTRGGSYADSDPEWGPGDIGTIVYDRRPVVHAGGAIHLGKAHLWSVQTDGTENGPG